MTIVEAIRVILNQHPEGLTSKEIHDQIIQQKLYDFKAKNPVGVVNGELRRRCIGLDFPTAHPVKQFKIQGHRGKQILFSLSNTQDSSIPTESPYTSERLNILESLPEERIVSALQEHLSLIKQQLLDHILDQPPAFFEQLVVDLLLKMGYGYDNASGIVTGGSHDGGIDGIISEDKLGLDLIYIQAKRYSSTKNVGRKELQAFIGAMGHIQKGVFITTSSFTKDASVFCTQQQQKSLKLINGQQLTNYMVKYGLGVEIAKSINIYKINTDYFSE